MKLCFVWNFQDQSKKIKNSRGGFKKVLPQLNLFCQNMEMMHTHKQGGGGRGGHVHIICIIITHCIQKSIHIYYIYIIINFVIKVF